MDVRLWLGQFHVLRARDIISARSTCMELPKMERGKSDRVPAAWERIKSRRTHKVLTNQAGRCQNEHIFCLLPKISVCNLQTAFINIWKTLLLRDLISSSSLQVRSEEEGRKFARLQLMRVDESYSLSSFLSESASSPFAHHLLLVPE